MWGILPLSSFFNNRQSRWTLGARDILFTRPFVPSYQALTTALTLEQMAFRFFQERKSH